LTLVYQRDAGCRRWLWLGQERRVRTLLKFFCWFAKQRSGTLRFICSDRWQPYLKVVAKTAAGAMHVLERFYSRAKMDKAIDEMRAPAAKALVARGYELMLKHSRWLLLKRPENLTEKQAIRLAELVQYNLAVRPTCSRKTSKRSGAISRRTGRASFSSAGAGARCVLASSR
jgi:transposase